MEQTGKRLYLRASRRMHPTNSWLLGSLTSRTEDKMCILSLWGLLQHQQEINTSTTMNVNDTFCICLINHGHSRSTSTCVPGSCLLALSLLVTDSVDVAKPSNHFLAFSYLTFEKHLAGNFSSPGFSINWTLWFAVKLPPSFSFY